MIIAVDFDGTLVQNLYPKIGFIRQDVFDYVKAHQSNGDTIILWTCREGDLLNAALSFCKENGLVFDYVNDNAASAIETYGNNSRKVHADIYIDDKSVAFLKSEIRSAATMKEQRICEIRAEAAADAKAFRLEGRPIVYDQPTIINDPKGQYTEIIRTGALDDTDISDTRLLYNHDLNRVPLARTPKTMQFTKSPAGLHMIATLPDTQEAKSVHTAVLRGDLSGMSFAFTVPAGGDRYNAETNTREIFKISKIYEVSIVPYPAYPQASVEARAVMQESTNLARLKREAVITANKILMKEV